jgi:hypothetical protein
VPQETVTVQLVDGNDSIVLRITSVGNQEINGIERSTAFLEAVYI